MSRTDGQGPRTLRHATILAALLLAGCGSSGSGGASAPGGSNEVLRPWSTCQDWTAASHERQVQLLRTEPFGGAEATARSINGVVDILDQLCSERHYKYSGRVIDFEAEIRAQLGLRPIG